MAFPLSLASELLPQFFRGHGSIRLTFPVQTPFGRLSPCSTLTREYCTRKHGDVLTASFPVVRREHPLFRREHPLFCPCGDKTKRSVRWLPEPSSAHHSPACPTLHYVTKKYEHEHERAGQIPTILVWEGYSSNTAAAHKPTHFRFCLPPPDTNISIENKSGKSLSGRLDRLRTWCAHTTERRFETMETIA